MKQNETKVQKNPSPWLRMWLHPKQTVIDSDKRFTVSTYLLIWILGIHVALSFAQEVHSGDSHSLGYTLGISLLRAILYGAVIWGIYGVLSYWLGRLFGGKGTWRSVFHALAFAQVPMLGYLVVYWPLALGVFGAALFSSAEVSLDPGQMMLNLVALLVNLVLGIWYIVTVSKAIAGAHGFSSWKGFLTFVALIVLIFLLLMGFQTIG
ncbi:Yip1 family protein [Virgibacillus halophilus]|uniref:Yip1 family protein n=1 Tax=Tigheibacillus halophilus TaxID=361280 RepID=UPI0036392097